MDWNEYERREQIKNGIIIILAVFVFFSLLGDKSYSEGFEDGSLYAEQIEEDYWEIYNEGYNAGFEEGEKSAYHYGYADGHKDGMEEALIIKEALTAE